MQYVEGCKENSEIIMSNSDSSDEECELTPADIKGILIERNELRELNVKLQRVISEYAKYLSCVEEELNTTLIEKLIGEECDENDVNNESGCINDSTNRIHFTPNLSGFLNITSDENGSSGKNLSFLQTELNTCLERLRTEASSILALTSGKVTSRQDEFVQTEADFDPQQQVEVWREKYDRAIDENGLLKEKISNLESAECFGQSLEYCENRRNVNTDNHPKSPQSPQSPNSPQLMQMIDDLTEELRVTKSEFSKYKKYWEEQTKEQDCEREKFDEKIKEKDRKIREMEKELSTKRGLSDMVKQLEMDVKDVTEKYENVKGENSLLKNKLSVEFDKVSSLRERIQELEEQIFVKAESIEAIRAENAHLQSKLEDRDKSYESLMRELESLRDGGLEQVQSLKKHQDFGQYVMKIMKKQLLDIEQGIVKKAKELECASMEAMFPDACQSEEISVADRLEAASARVNTADTDSSHAADTDLSSPSSSSEAIIEDYLGCLRSKIEKLYRAQDLAIQLFREQDMRLKNMLREEQLELENLQLERENLQDELKDKTEKLSELRMKFEQSDSFLITHDNMKHTVNALRTKNRSLTDDNLNKDAEIITLKRTNSHLSDKYAEVKNAHKTKIKEYNLEMDSLKREIELLTSEKHELKDFLRNYVQADDDVTIIELVRHVLDEKISQLATLESRLAIMQSGQTDSCSQSNNGASTGASNTKHSVNFSDHVTYYPDDSDITRHAINSNPSISQCILSPMYSAEGALSPPKNKQEEWFSSKQFVNKQVGKVSPHLSRSKFDESGPERRKQEGQLKEITFFLQEEKKLRQLKQEEVNRLREQLNELSASESNYKGLLEEEKKDHFNTLRKLQEVSKDLENERCKYREFEVKCAQMREFENELKSLKVEKQCLEVKYEECKSQLSEVKNELGQNKRDVESLRSEAGDYKDRCDKLESRNESLTRQCGEMLTQLNEAREKVSTMEEARLRSVECNENYIKMLNNEREFYANDLKSLKAELEKSIAENKSFKDKLANASKEIESKAKIIDELRHEISVKCDFESNTSAKELGELTERLGKEVDSAIKLQDNLTGNIHFIDRIMPHKSLTSGDVLALIKLFKNGNSALESEDYQQILKVIPPAILSTEMKRLKQELERMQTIAGYLEDSNARLFSKMEEYNAKYVQAEISSFKEKSRVAQLEILHNNFKQRTLAKEDEDKKQIHLLSKNCESLSDENYKLKLETNALSQKTLTLTAEINSLKVLGQYQTDSESELSRSIDPLRCDLEKAKTKCADLETKLRGQLENNKSQCATLARQKLEIKNLELSLDKLYEKKLKLKSEMENYRVEISQLKKVNKKLENKVELLELYNAKKRIRDDDSRRKELNESAAAMNALEANYNLLEEKYLQVRKQLENASEKSNSTPKFDLKTLCFHLLRAESRCKKLVWQKTYLQKSLNGYSKLNLDKMRRLANGSPNCRKNEGAIVRPTRKLKFKTVAMIFVSVFRMKYLIKRRQCALYSLMEDFTSGRLDVPSALPLCEAESLPRSPSPTNSPVFDLYMLFKKLQEHYLADSNWR